MRVGRRIDFMVMLLAVLSTPLRVSAEDGVNLDAVRKELQAAKASQAGADAFSLKDGDLAKRRAALLAAENALLSELADADKGKSPDSSNIASNVHLATQPVQKRVVKEVVVAPTTPIEAPALNESTQKEIEMPKASFKAEEFKDESLVVRSEQVPVARDVNLGNLDTIKSATSALEENIAELKRANFNLDSQLKTARTQSSSLQKELESTRDRLMIAEAEVERLKGVLKARNSETLNNYGIKSASHHKVESARKVESAQPPKVVPTSAPKIAEDVVIATVIADKANLRTGPGKDNSPFMTVPQGARLTVETRNGDWYRVITPTGTRAWIASEVLAFGENGHTPPTSTLRIRGYNSNLERFTGSNETLKLSAPAPR